MKKQYLFSVQEWLPFEKILERGIIKKKDKSYVKIIKIIPINYNLKSDLEKEAILNSYKTFLKTCHFDLQILIQSNKEDLSKHISLIKQQMKKENNSILLQLSEEYLNFIQENNKEKISSSKNFFILLKISNQNKQEKTTDEERIIEQLNENYFKVKECLSRCGNLALEIDTKQETQTILYSFLNTKEYFCKKEKGEETYF